MTRVTSLLGFALVILLGYLTYQIFSPFLTAIAWAVVFGVVFYPVYLFILRFLRVRIGASLVTMLLIVAVVVGPLSYVSFALFSEVTDFVMKSQKGDPLALQKVLSDRRVVRFFEQAGPYVGVSETSARQFLTESGKKLGTGALDYLSTGFTNMLNLAANFVMMLFTVFFIFKDGAGLAARVKDYLPFPEAQRERLARQTQDMIVSTIYGGVVVAITQGILGGICFAFLGITSPVLWGSVMALASFLPVVGTAIVWIPWSLVLMTHGLYLKGVGLLLIGVFVISMADNILRPMIIGGRTKMPTIIIFFTVLGGIKFFGLLGLILGPLVFALFLSIFEILRTMEVGDEVSPDKTGSDA